MMKNLLWIRMAVTAIASVVLAFQVHAEPEVKKVCHSEKGKQVCKQVKVHQKLDGTKVPPK